MSELSQEFPAAPEPAPEPVSDATPERYPFWSFLDVLFVFGLLIVAVLITSLIAGIAGVRAERPTPIATAVIQIAVYASAIAALYLVVAVRYGRRFWEAFQWSASPRALMICALAGPVAAIAGGLVSTLLGGKSMNDLPMGGYLTTRALIAVLGVFAVTLGPLLEELIFRGFLLPLISKHAGVAIGLLTTSALFAAMHGSEYAWTWQAMLQMMFAGACFGWAKIWSGSTGAATVMHCTFNFVAFAAFLLSQGQPAQ